MNANIDVHADRPGAGRFTRHVGKPARWSSSRLAIAIGQLIVFSRRQPDTTLGELQTAVLGPAEGRPGLSADRDVLLEEFDALIEVHGPSARLAEVFL